jgi:hypothetical protein
LFKLGNGVGQLLDQFVLLLNLLSESGELFKLLGFAA